MKYRGKVKSTTILEGGTKENAIVLNTPDCLQEHWPSDVEIQAANQAHED